MSYTPQTDIDNLTGYIHDDVSYTPQITPEALEGYLLDGVTNYREIDLVHNASGVFRNLTLIHNAAGTYRTVRVLEVIRDLDTSGIFDDTFDDTFE